MSQAYASNGLAARTSPLRALAVLAASVTAAEILVMFVGEAPAQHRWLSVGLTLATLGTAFIWRGDVLRQVAWLGLLSGSAVVARETVRFDRDLPPLLVALDVFALLAVAVIAVLAVVILSRAIGRQRSLLAALAGTTILGCVGLVLERSPGARLGVSATTVYKGPFPHRTFGQWYPPGTRVRGFFAADPRGYYDPPADLPRQWRLNIHTSRDLAELRFDPKTPKALRVEILHSEPGENWAIQLNQGPIVVHAGRPYALKFTARADRARNISVAVSEWHPPWQWLGFSRTIQVGPEWTPWSDTFTLLRDDTNARVHFDLGNDSASVELADVVLTDLTTGEGIFPDPLPYSLTHQFNEVGCRGDAALERAREDTRRILVLGDSYALGLGVRDKDLIAARVARLLEEGPHSSEAAGQRYVAMTCAVPGWGARQERLFYESLRRRYLPSLVIVATTWNDGRLEQGEVSPPDGATSEHLDYIAPELQRLAGLVQSDGARLAVVVFRNTSAAIWQRTLHALQPLEKAGVPVLDLWPSLTANHQWEQLVDTSPAALPNEVAHGIAAAAIAPFLRSHGLAP
jgi:hypothetical protein